MRVHSGEKPFVCLQCNYSCNQPDRLRIHMRIHSREKIVMSKLLINCLLQMPYRFFFIFPTYVTTLRTCELVVDDTLDGENNLEKKTREVSEFMVVSHPRWRKFQLNWYTPMSATSLVFSSRFFSPSTAPSTNNMHEQKLGKGSHPERKVQFFLTLFKRPLTPPPFIWTLCGEFFWRNFNKRT